jgi:hypothetical protein
MTVDLWEEVRRAWPLPQAPDRATERDAFIAFLVVAMALLLSRYGETALWRLLPREITRGQFRHGYRDVFWAGFTCISYLLPATIHLRLRGLRWSDHGWRLRGSGPVWSTYLLLYLLVLPVVVVASFGERFRETYPMLDPALRATGWLFVYEGLYALQFIALELLLRGYMLFLPGRVLGPWAVPAMIVPYVMLHFRKPLPECLGAAVTGFLLGCLAMKSRTVIPGAVLHIAVAWTMDALAWRAWRSGG